MPELHEGHRSRMYEKLFQSPESLCDHELLEILLFFVLPRVNTNPIAHELIERFGSLNAVFRASPESLQNVNGVGKNTANYLVSVGAVMRRVSEYQEDIPQIFNVYTFGGYVEKKYATLSKEVLDVYFIDKSSSMTGSYRMSSELLDRVSIEPKELISVIASSKAAGILIVHNHINAPADPSKEDDALTKQCQLICSMCNIRFYDHLIYSPSGIYSYYAADRLGDIAQKYNINRIMK